MSGLEAFRKSRIPDRTVAFTSDPAELMAFLGRNLNRDPARCLELAQEILAVSVAGAAYVDVQSPPLWQQELGSA